jgi:hypothetical protein
VRAIARHRSTLLIVLVAVVAVVVTAWAARGKQTYPASLDPANPDGKGAQAVERVLADEGVEVDVVRSADALDRAAVDASTTIVVTSAGNLGRSTTDRLLQHQGTATLVVVGPGPELVRQLGLTSYPVTTTPDGPVAAGCPAYDGLSLRVTTSEAFDADGCFRGRGGVLLAQARPGLTLLGAPEALTNDQVLDGDNAAVALRLLGQRPHLVWYVPALADLAGADSVSASSLLPHWLRPALWLLVVTGVALVVWRGRRLGPLAREPLPVEVKAIETTRNLGRLYRRAADRQHAAEALRDAARTRLCERLGLPRNAARERVVRAVASHTGRSEAAVGTLLGLGSPDGSFPHTDEQLTALAHDLTELDREVSPA